MLSRTRFICLVIMAAVSTGSTVPNCARSYVVKEGDTCDSICNSQSVSKYQLESLNSDIIHPMCIPNEGETLCLGMKGQDCLHTYAIQVGDTCFSIATAFGTVTSTLLSNNPNILWDCSNIYLGEVLCVDKVFVHYTTK